MIKRRIISNEYLLETDNERQYVNVIRALAFNKCSAVHGLRTDVAFRCWLQDRR